MKVRNKRRLEYLHLLRTPWESSETNKTTPPLITSGSDLSYPAFDVPPRTDISMATHFVLQAIFITAQETVSSCGV